MNFYQSAEKYLLTEPEIYLKPVKLRIKTESEILQQLNTILPALYNGCSI